MKNLSMKACSFVPAATRMIYDMGLQEYLHGVTFECFPAALKEKPKLVRCLLEGKHYSSDEIDRIFSSANAQGKSLYYIDEELLEYIQPDIIFTQDVCEVCQIDTRCTTAAIAKLKKPAQILPLTPRTLIDVYETAVAIANALRQEDRAYKYLSSLKSRTDAVLNTLRTARMPLKRVSLLEWIEPIYTCGHWIPFQLAQAGAIDMLGNPGGYSVVTAWEKLVQYDPEILVIAPCGFEIKRSMEELHILTEKEKWRELQAVRNRRVYLIDSDLFTQPSASTLTDGIELLAALFHPELFSVPQHLRHKFIDVGREVLYSIRLEI